MAQVDLNADDLATRPWEYPGKAPEHSGLLAGGSYRQMAIKPGLDGRQLVVAVGSNASPAVMRRKLSRRGVSTVIPFVTAEADGIGAAHSAHVSKAGYVAAAPFPVPGRKT